MYADIKHSPKAWTPAEVINKTKLGWFEGERQISDIFGLTMFLLASNNRKRQGGFFRDSGQPHFSLKIGLNSWAATEEVPWLFVSTSSCLGESLRPKGLWKTAAHTMPEEGKGCSFSLVLWWFSPGVLLQSQGGGCHGWWSGGERSTPGDGRESWHWIWRPVGVEDKKSAELRSGQRGGIGREMRRWAWLHKVTGNERDWTQTEAEKSCNWSWSLCRPYENCYTSKTGCLAKSK